MNTTIKTIFATCLLLLATTLLQAQMGVGTNSPHTSAKLEIKSTTQGFLPPRMLEAERIAISSPAAGLMVYQTDATNGLYYYSGSSWIHVINSTSNILTVANGGTGVTTSTGSGKTVLSTSPTLVTPILGTPTSVTLTNAIGLPLSSGVTGILSVNNGGTGATTFSGILIGNGTSAVTAVAPGTTGNLLTSNGTSWASVASLVPPGVINTYAGSAAPTGYLLCDGSQVSRTTYADLFAIIGTSYGAGNGSTTFNLPDLRGRTVFGVDNMGGTAANRLTTTGGISSNNSRGATGGKQTVTLIEGNLPSHNHTFTGSSTTTSSDIHSHTYQDAYFAENIGAGGTGSNLRFGTAASSDTDNSFYWRTSTNTHNTSPQNINTSQDTHSHTVTAAGSISVTGSDTAFQNLPPLMVLNYIIKF